MSLYQELKGTGVALVTPFDEKGAVDLAALKSLIDHVIGNGCDYVVTLGTTGETPVLEREERIALIEFTYDAVNKRVPVVVGIGGNNTASLQKDLRQFPLERAAAVLSASPYYSKPSQEGIFQHYKALASVSPKPILLYNVPGRTGRGMTSTTILKLAHEVPNIAGIKDASGDMVMGMELLKKRPASFLVLSGDDPLALAQIACGMDGVISVAANAFPKQFSSLVNASLKGDLKEAAVINDRLLDVYDLLFCENNPAGIKAFLYEMNIIQNFLRLPLVPLSKEVHDKVRNFLLNNKY